MDSAITNVTIMVNLRGKNSGELSSGDRVGRSRAFQLKQSKL